MSWLLITSPVGHLLLVSVEVAEGTGVPITDGSKSAGFATGDQLGSLRRWLIHTE